MQNPVAKDHLNPNRFGPEEGLGYGEWQVLPEDYGPFDPYFVKYAVHEDELAEVIPYTDGLIARLRDRYEIRDNARVENYIERYPVLSGLLTDAHDKTRKYFDSDAGVVLDVIKDSEMDDHERLFIFIQTELSADEALDRLDELYEQWWLGALSGVRPKLSIDVEFV